MFCGLGKKNRGNQASRDGQALAPLPKPRGLTTNCRSEENGCGGEGSSSPNTPVDLRAEKDEPLHNNTRLIDYLLTEVVTKTDERRLVQRLFTLSPNALSCFYESAPHL